MSVSDVRFQPGTSEPSLLGFPCRSCLFVSFVDSKGFHRCLSVVSNVGSLVCGFTDGFEEVVDQLTGGDVVGDSGVVGDNAVLEDQGGDLAKSGYGEQLLRFLEFEES